MGRYGDIDYARSVKRGVALGLLLLGLGELDGYLRSTYLSLPAWEEALFLDVAVLGLLVVVLSPVIFGVVLPLTE